MAGAAPIDVHSQNKVEFDILRGVATGGIWVELAYDTSGNAELAILDGLPGTAPSTRFVTLSRATGDNGCELSGEGGRVVVSPCPARGANTYRVKVYDLDATAVLETIHPHASYGWPPAIDFAAMNQQCQLPSLQKFEPIRGTPLSEAVLFVSAEAKGMSLNNDADRKQLPVLRAERLRLYGILALTPQEQQRKAVMDDAISGRAVLGNRVSVSEAAMMKDRFERDVVQHPARVQARTKLQQVERSLADIYDVRRSNESMVHYERLLTQGPQKIADGLNGTLAAKLPRRIQDLADLEPKMGEIDACLTALGVQPYTTARQVAFNALVERSDEIVSVMLAAVRSAPDSTAARTVLTSYENNATLMQALQKGGRGAAVTEARTHVTQLAAKEEKDRLAEIRLAEAEAARNQVPVAIGGGSGRQLNINNVKGSIYYIETTDSKGRTFRGSGFAVSNNHIATNEHVVEDGVQIYVVLNGGNMTNNKLRAKIVAVYPYDDLAILYVEGLNGKRLPIATNEAPQASMVWALGFPGVADELDNKFNDDYKRIMSVSQGNISRYIPGNTSKGYAAHTPTKTVEHTAVIAQGNSGGPLVDACNRVVGVVAMFRKDVNNVYNRADFGISNTVLAERLKENNIPATYSSTPC